MSTESTDLGPSSVLGGDFSGELASTLRDRLDLALRYLANWYRATKGADDQALWWTKIDQVRDKVEIAYRSFSPNDVFLSPKAVSAYNDAALAFPALHMELSLSADTIPHPDLIDRASGLLDTLIETPGYLVSKIGDMAARSIGGVAGSVVEQLWPYLLIVGVVYLLLIFRAPIVALVS